ncbi:SDR family NAD(P)-dependent oxidoreductase [Salibacterium aidingense]|uniref:SDR family NAD(P)-dependent oxidoreductase n=1 Tax=Salibacterium aidingense TaxID=384933 RepID=UPI003BEC83AF
MGKLDDKTAIITGGAAGIGRQTAILFAREGANVVITDVDENKGKQVLEEIKAINGNALFIKHDVSQENEWKTVVTQTTQQFNHIDILFNNAGIYIIKPIPEIDAVTWNKVMNINVTGVFLGLKHVLPVMEKYKAGSVINASSTAGLRGTEDHLLYGASKGAVSAMTKNAAAEYASKGIRINSIHPNYITTAMADYASGVTHQSKEEMDTSHPLGRMGHPNEVAKTVLFLASEDASFSTGAEFVIDGGATSIL